MAGTRAHTRIWLATAMLVSLALPGAALAFSGGLPSTVFGLTGCTLCHSGGSDPVVVLSGPTAVDPGQTVDYTLTIFGTPLQAHGGLTVMASTGSLAVGGPFATGTRAIAGLGGLTEITHTGPKQGDFSNIIEYSFRWTAPADFSGGATLTGWGSAVDLNLLALGDGATRVTLAIESTGPAPTPTASPTPAPDYCTDIAPPEPPLIGAKDAAVCQRAVVRAGTLIVKKSLRAMQTCLKRFHATGGSDDPETLCVGSTATLPLDARAAAVLTKIEAKGRALLDAKCSDATVAALGLCADTVGDAADCLIASHRAVLADVLAAQYGALQPAGDPAVRRCQSVIGSSAAAYLGSYRKAAQKCVLARNAAGLDEPAGARCIGAVSGGEFTPPADAKAATAIARAADTLAAKLAKGCDEAHVGALASCGRTGAALARCLTCASRRGAITLLASELGGE